MVQTLFRNATVLTMDDADTCAGAVLCEAGRILSVGTPDAVLAQAAPDAEMRDLGGRTLIPGFIDSHGHFPDPGFHSLFRVDLSAPPRGDCPDIRTVLTRLKHRATETPEGSWVVGVLFDNTSVAERRMPTRAELDAVSDAHPVWVLHVSGHYGAANSLALSHRGFDRDSPDPPGGVLGRDQTTGELNGLVEGMSAMGDMGDTDFDITPRQFWQGYAAARDEYLAQGLTFAQNSWTNQSLLDQFAQLGPDADPGFDLMLLPAAELEPALSQRAGPTLWPGNPHFPLGPRKLFSDGAFQFNTAFLSDPYLKPVDPAMPRGLTYLSRDEIGHEVMKLHGLGFQIHCHCNGDAAADMFIDAVEAALNADPRPDNRHTIVHGQTLRDDQLERMARLGMSVTFFAAHIHFWGDRHYDTYLGPERAARISPAGSAERLGVRYTIHNDATVTPTRPLHLAHCAVNRVTASGRLLGEDQKISVLSALRAQTIDAAWQVFAEDERGSIEPGKRADLAVLPLNPLENPDKLADMEVDETIIAQRTRFRRPEAPR